MRAPMETTKKRYELISGAERASTPKHKICGAMLGKVIKVHDGDTCWVAVLLPGRARPEYLRVRMLGYDAPELKGKSLDYAKEVRDVLRKLILGKVVLLAIPPDEKDDPYGRTLGHIYVMPRDAPARAIRASRFCCFGLGSVDAPTPPGPDAKEAERVTVRGRKVEVPPTISIPGNATVAIGDMLCVNVWMADHSGSKPYDGKKGRPEWTDGELERGYFPQAPE